MVTFIFLALWALTIYIGYAFISNLLWLLPVWILVGPFISILIIVLVVVLMMPIMKRTKPDWKPKFILIKGAANFIKIFFIRYKIKIEGKENIPKTGRLTVYANHKSQTDPVGIMANFNRSLAFTPKISLYKIPIMSHYMNYIGCLPIDRDDNRRTARTMIQAIKNVENGLALLIFPEGGIVDKTDERIKEIKAGAFQIGKKSKSNMLPITIIGATKFLNRKWYQRVTVKIIVHPLINYEDISELSTQELGEMMKDIINSPFDKVVE